MIEPIAWASLALIIATFGIDTLYNKAWGQLDNPLKAAFAEKMPFLFVTAICMAIGQEVLPDAPGRGIFAGMVFATAFILNLKAIPLLSGARKAYTALVAVSETTALLLILLVR
jgi:hypothetical protein